MNLETTKIMKKHNFSAGPAILPASVMEEAAQAARDFNGMGLSILEISHRSPAFIAVLDEAEALVRELLGLSDEFAVIWLSGGASTQFFMAPMNLLDEGETAAYADTGTWSEKAIQEAKNFGTIEVVASSKAENYNHIPKGFSVPAHAKYLHLTSNNTIFGTQYHHWPEVSMPLVADMSSDIFSRPLEVERFGLIYAGAQKNLGPAGTTLLIVRKDMLGKVSRKLPAMLDYRLHIENGSTYNTPPVFPIFASMLTLRWIKANGGLAGMARHNEAKAKLLYAEIDANPMFQGVVAREDRSLMNAVFVMAPGKEALEKDFLAAAKEVGCVDIKGHRSAGGFRASIYNAMPLESVKVLVEAMQAFAQKHA